MARIVKKPHERRSELIACAQKFFLTKGFESTSVSDIVEEIGVAKGTFYYYFDSKQDILEAMVNDLSDLAVKEIQSIISNESIPAITKWTQAFQALNNWKLGRKGEMIAFARVLYLNENVHLQHKLRI
ncbi:MAG: TetR/AcrR family transcriptional regulator, partial [Anaerolineales bacterium]|nr:TetR/AcrR family transcriptional regulator [Anaerolineales bacterium]